MWSTSQLPDLRGQNEALMAERERLGHDTFNLETWLSEGTKETSRVGASDARGAGAVGKAGDGGGLNWGR